MHMYVPLYPAVNFIKLYNFDSQVFICERNTDTAATSPNVNLLQTHWKIWVFVGHFSTLSVRCFQRLGSVFSAIVLNDEFAPGRGNLSLCRNAQGVAEIFHISISIPEFHFQFESPTNDRRQDLYKSQKPFSGELLRLLISQVFTNITRI